MVLAILADDVPGRSDYALEAREIAGPLPPFRVALHKGALTTPICRSQISPLRDCMVPYNFSEADRL